MIAKINICLHISISRSSSDIVTGTSSLYTMNSNHEMILNDAINNRNCCNKCIDSCITACWNPFKLCCAENKPKLSHESAL